MERDESVGESAPHIANIGRLVEVSMTDDNDDDHSHLAFLTA